MEPVETGEKEYRGYLSREAKRAFTNGAVVMVVAYFLLQFLLPFLLMAAWIPSVISGFAKFSVPRPARGCVWNGAAWYPTSAVSAENCSSTIVRLPLAGELAPIRVGTVEMANPWLLPAEDRIWLIGAEGIAWVKEGAPPSPPEGGPLGDIARPFLFKGSPAVLQELPSGLFLLTYREGRWRNGGAVALPPTAKTTVGSIQVVSGKDGALFFWRKGRALYCREGIPMAGESGARRWELVGNVGCDWSALGTPEEPAVFSTEIVPSPQHGPVEMLTVLRRAPAGWRELIRHRLGFASSAGVYSREKPGELAIVSAAVFGRSRLVEVRDGAVTGERKFGDSFPGSLAPVPLMAAVFALFVVLTLALAYGLSRIMTMHRVARFRDFVEAGGERTGPAYASLMKRCAAELVDSLIEAIPVVIIVGVSLERVFDFDSMFPPMFIFRLYGLIAQVLLWTCVVGVLLSWLEGRWGQTPGKMLMKIKVVGTDNGFQPCGFLRALLRRFLLVVDGYCGYLVGILLVAFTERWQRVGDLAVKTIVVEVES